MGIATGPSWHLVRYADVIENAADDKVHQFFNAARAMIEAGRCGHDHGTGSRQAQHVLEVDVAVGRFARNDHKPAALLQDDISGALDQRP